jgi:hypothetical protein
MSQEPPASDSRITTAASLAYWASILADENGMLGGFAQISRADLQGSRCFLAKLGLSADSASRRSLRSTAGGGGSGSGSGSVEMERGEGEEKSQRRAEERPTTTRRRRIARAVDCGAG